MSKVTEQESKYNDLEHKNISELLVSINIEDKTVPYAIEKAMPQIESLIQQVVEKLKIEGRLFYIGAGTSGRLGIVDASECPPTFGIEHGKVIGIIAGGDKAIRKAVEFAEDNTKQGWIDLQEYHINTNDVVIGIAASGSTPYVIGALEECNANKIITGCITCNPDSELAKVAKFPITVVVGPEVVTGSTRMKSGTAQKLVLNMISTVAMIKLGRVKGNRMVDMQPSNNKLVDRGAKMISNETGLDYATALGMLRQHGNVRKAIEYYQSKNK